MEFQDKVLGVIHAVQPSRGTPSAYWRMKAGFERPRSSDWGNGFLSKTVVSWCLGTNGEEVTALVGNMPGALCLLPNSSYRTATGGRQWLNLAYEGRLFDSMPWLSPYNEIYREKHAIWRLVDPKYLNPGDDAEKAWGDDLKYLSIAESFHARLGDAYHPNTWHVAGTGVPTEEDVRFSPRLYSLSLDYKPGRRDFKFKHVGGDAERDSCKSFGGVVATRMNGIPLSGGFMGESFRTDGRQILRCELWLQQGNQPVGDGTVSLSSPAAEMAHVSAARHKVIQGLDHESAMKSPEVHAFIRRAIGSMCHKKIAIAVREARAKPMARISREGITSSPR